MSSTADSATRRRASTRSGRTFIDDSGFEEIDGEVVKERRQLAYDGVVTPVVTIDEESGELEGEPEVVARGVLGLDGNGGSAALLSDMRSVVTATVEAASRDERRDSSILKERVRARPQALHPEADRRAPRHRARRRANLNGK